ncbi:MAG: ABC transporter permease [Pseudomonadota bacterium]
MSLFRGGSKEIPGTPSVVIDSNRPPFLINWDEYRDKLDLFWFLALRDLKVRFKQTILGSAWAFLKPLMLMIVFTVFLGYVVKFPTDGIPYPLFYYSALVFWNFFVTGMSLSSESLLSNGFLLNRVYCPILFIPAAPVVAQFVDLGMALVTLIGLMLYSGIWPSIRLLLVPVLFVIVLAATFGMGLLFAPLIARYRDFQNLMAVLTQMWFFMSPVIYPTSLVPERWKLLYSLNPMVGAIEGFRWTIMGSGPFPMTEIVLGMVSALALLSIGFLYFIKNSEGLADVI